MKSREDAARFIELQMNYESNASKNKTAAHYGWLELRELMDFIYCSKPTTIEQELKNDIR